MRDAVWKRQNQATIRPISRKCLPRLERNLKVKPIKRTRRLPRKRTLIEDVDRDSVLCFSQKSPEVPIYTHNIRYVRKTVAFNLIPVSDISLVPAMIFQSILLVRMCDS